MKADPVFRGFKTEMQSFASFYGFASLIAVGVFGVVYFVVPHDLLSGHVPFAVVASFLAGCGVTSLVFERHRKHHGH
jgi:hypothetical protein